VTDSALLNVIKINTLDLGNKLVGQITVVWVFFVWA